MTISACLRSSFFARLGVGCLLGVLGAPWELFGPRSAAAVLSGPSVLAVTVHHVAVYMHIWNTRALTPIARVVARVVALVPAAVSIVAVSSITATKSAASEFV